MRNYKKEVKMLESKISELEQDMEFLSVENEYLNGENKYLKASVDQWLQEAKDCESQMNVYKRQVQKFRAKCRIRS